jgi:hypothetical protein
VNIGYTIFKKSVVENSTTKKIKNKIIFTTTKIKIERFIKGKMEYLFQKI